MYTNGRGTPRLSARPVQTASTDAGRNPSVGGAHSEYSEYSTLLAAIYRGESRGQNRFRITRARSVGSIESDRL